MFIRLVLVVVDLSSDELKICENCSIQIDRDVNGAKNIYFFNRHLVN